MCKNGPFLLSCAVEYFRTERKFDVEKHSYYHLSVILNLILFQSLKFLDSKRLKFLGVELKA
jgi:hypothetical protein